MYITGADAKRIREALGQAGFRPWDIEGIIQYLGVKDFELVHSDIDVDFEDESELLAFRFKWAEA